ncbi:MAG: translation initiation factor IF-2 subunit alpha [Candidatus Nanoarchaeia archaeon]
MSKLVVIKEGMPDEGDIVLCTVTKIYPTSVFAVLDEYEKTGMIHISEISPGRIRNLHDYVKVGKKIVCKILRIDLQKGHIDLSYRRVTESQRRNKVNELKQEQKAEKIVEFVAGKMKQSANDLYEQLANKIFASYVGLYPCFEEAVADKGLLKKVGIQDNVAKELQEVIEQRIKPPEVQLKGVLKLKSYAPDGVDKVKESLDAAQKAAEVKIIYLGGGRYSVSVKSDNYKDAEKKLDKAVSTALSQIEKTDGQGVFERVEAD